MQDDLIKVAAANLKKTLPLMLKHQIPTTPTNYAVWYTYVGGQSPELNQTMDRLLQRYQTCPPAQSELLYREFVSDPLELNVRQLRQNLEAMVIELSQSVKDTNRDADLFQQQIKTNFSKLSRLEQESLSLEQVMDLMRNFINESDKIQTSTAYFIDQLQKAENEIHHLREKLEKSEKNSLYDSLTGTLNRRAFDMDIEGLLTQSPEGCCIILLDIDHFKAFNDTFGHLLGDQVLKSVAQRLNDFCQNRAKLYRFGGEEFVILVPASEIKRARHLAESLRRGIEKLSIRDRRKGGTVDSITASFGVAQWQTGMSALKLIELADSLLCEAKRLGRNRVMPITN
ncbi:MAG: diguanylate cyclase [Shewanella sp.]|nr:diguanylate cyclase [Shewanella sp.]MCF1431534.1 diguanylate cyclase [Shewanella sp.]MCF1439272.1 diguanylate cyclase [Shewanella sp.]MCF1458920.1 diguanylate cyclase [Shewanella sp.]